MTTLPRIVSVIIGTRNRPETLRAAMRSIRALEGPDLSFEILVGDNGTTPETPGVVAECGGKYARTDVYGCPAARNVAMRQMQGEFIAFLDDDDVWLPGHIRPHIALLDAHPEFGAVFGQVRLADGDLLPFGEPFPQSAPADGDFFTTMLSGFFPQVGATLVRAKVATQHGLMDETLIGDSDWDWQLRIARNHKIGFVTVPCVLFRQRTKGTFDSLQRMRTAYTRKIFYRHALPNMDRWSTPVGMLRSYYKTVSGYCTYFFEAAADRASAGDYRGALSAVASAIWISPIRAARNLLRPSTFRMAFALALRRRPAAAADPAKRGSDA